MATLGTFGEKYDLCIRQGATFGPIRAQMFNPDNVTPVNLTGATVRGQIRKKALDAAVVATLACVITDPLLGKYEFGLDVFVTTVLIAGDTPEDAKSQYAWDLELEDSLGRVTPLYYGKVSVLREVTRV
jgi:hypothetical protein